MHTKPMLLSDNILLQVLQASTAPTAIFFGENLIVQFANQGMLKLLGKEASIIGMPLFDAVPQLACDDLPILLQRLGQHADSALSQDSVLRSILDATSNDPAWYSFQYEAIADPSGGMSCILCTARPTTCEQPTQPLISESESGEEPLKIEIPLTLDERAASTSDLETSIALLSESREHMRTIIEQAPVGIAMLKGPEHVIEIANSTILHIWGRQGADVIGLPHRQARPELIGQPVYDWLDQVYNTGKRKTNNEFAVNLSHNGGLRQAIVNSIYQPIFAADGQVTGVLVILEEITEQVTARRKNEKDQHMLNLALDAGQLATFYYEPETNLFAGNHLLHTWFGLAPAGYIDLSEALAVIIEEDRQRVIDAIQHSLAPESTGSYAAEYRIQAANDTAERMVQARGQVLYDTAGRAVSLNGTLRDITEQKKDEQRKDDFIGMVSHELKTPLTSLKAYLQLMQRAADGATSAINQHNALDKSLRQVENMTNMINGFLNISRLDAGKMLLNRSPFSLKILFAELQEEVLHTVQSHQIVFEALEDVALYADREKIAQVIFNLVGNAVKYSPVASRIDLRYTMLDSDWLEILVSDQGMGVAPDDQEKIFERYHRVKSSKMGSIAGFGIGLYLCREIIALHGGTIAVQKSDEQGTIFKMLLPIQ
ncbi:ATP-binding protein [Sphingobacterium bambusae]|uniref:histidine kinase n=1 Tax=Sphingobacterium bambusae TaxID=662858 RepID=A0ABW6BDK6_9SPHI|nr:ATP-binding protein [Sphingobacterium bambusae]WPL48831.1 PAS domain-containing protein [Sphingobacterium bambusae]